MEIPLIQATSVTHRYGGTTALAGTSVSIHRGESVAIMGPSGSGKSTLLHCLSAIVRPEAGRILFQGPAGSVDLASVSDRQRSQLRREVFGFVFQQGLLVPELTAMENVAFPLLLNGYRRRDSEERALSLLLTIGLEGLENRRIGELSGGQAQRVAIARAQVSGASVIFADEPTGALDSVTGASVIETLLSSTVGQGRTLIVVTHDESVAAQCSRTIRVKDGRIISDDLESGNPSYRFHENGSAQDKAQEDER